MRIVQVVAGQGDGGLERHVVTLANELAARHEVTLVAHPSFAGRISTAVKFAPLDLERSRLNPVGLWQLCQLLRKAKPDIIHAHANKAAAMVSRLRRFVPGRLVATIHNLKSETRMYRHFDRVIAVSRGLAAQLNRADVEVIYNGVPVPADAVTNVRENLTGPVVAGIGRLVPAKGFDLLLQAWVGLPGTLLIVGDGPERAALENLARTLGLGERVRFLGHRQDVPAIIRAVDFVVISSRREGFPLLLSEILLARQLVIATAVPGVAEVLPPALLTPLEDVAQLHQKLRAALADTAAFREQCAPVWEFAAVQLTVESMVRRTETVYRQVC